MANHEAVALPAEKPDGKVIYVDFEKGERIDQNLNPRERTDKQVARIEAISEPDDDRSAWEVIQDSIGNSAESMSDPNDEKSAWEVIQESAGNSAESMTPLAQPEIQQKKPETETLANTPEENSAAPETQENNSESTDTPENTSESEEIRSKAEKLSPEVAEKILGSIGHAAKETVPEDTAKNTEGKKALAEAKSDENKQMSLKDLLKGFKNNAIERAKLRATNDIRNLLTVEEEVSTPRESLNFAKTKEAKDFPELYKIQSNVEKAIFGQELTREERNNLSEEEQQAFLGAYEAATKRFYDRQIKKIEEEAHAINAEVDKNADYTKEYAERVHQNRQEAIRLKQAALERWANRKQIAFNTLKRSAEWAGNTKIGIVGKAIGRFSLRSGKALSAGFKAMRSAWQSSKKSK